LPICNECAKGVIQVGIDRVIATRPADYNKEWDESIKDAKALFKEAEVEYKIEVEK
jgi:dCMP deaminase